MNDFINKLNLVNIKMITRKTTENAFNNLTLKNDDDI